jgi:hypothetical protein
MGVGCVAAWRSARIGNDGCYEARERANIYLQENEKAK